MKISDPEKLNEKLKTTEIGDKANISKASRTSEKKSVYIYKKKTLKKQIWITMSNIISH